MKRGTDWEDPLAKFVECAAKLDRAKLGFAEATVALEAMDEQYWRERGPDFTGVNDLCRSKDGVNVSTRTVSYLSGIWKRLTYLRVNRKDILTMGVARAAAISKVVNLANRDEWVEAAMALPLAELEARVAAEDPMAPTTPAVDWGVKCPAEFVEFYETVIGAYRRSTRSGSRAWALACVMMEGFYGRMSKTVRGDKPGLADYTFDEPIPEHQLARENMFDMFMRLHGRALVSFDLDGKTKEDVENLIRIIRDAYDYLSQDEPEPLPPGDPPGAPVTNSDTEFPAAPETPHPVFGTDG